MLAGGEPFIWLTGGALTLCLTMIVGLLLLVLRLGSQTFVPGEAVEVRLHDGRVLLGEVAVEESGPLTADEILRDSEPNAKQLIARLTTEVGDLSCIPDEIRAGQIPLEKERELSALRLTRAKEELGAIAVVEQGRLETVAARREWVVGGKSSQIGEIRNEVEALQARLAAIEMELKLANDAFEYFTTALSAGDPRDAGLLLAADESFKKIGIASLIRCAAKKHGTDRLYRRRRSLRTGNFELTGEHFTWFSDYQIVDGGEKRPEGAVVLERVTWGRFYGYPREFIEVVPRPIPADERTLSEGIDFLNAHATLLEETSVLELLPEIQRLYDETRDRHIRAFLDSAPVADSEVNRVEFVTEAGEVIPRERILPATNITEMHIVSTGGDVAWKMFQSRHSEVRERFARMTELQKHELGREFAQQEKARLALRQAEIDHNLQVLELAQQIHSHELAADSLQQQQVQNASRLAELKRLLGRDTEMGTLADRMLQAASREIDRQKKSQLEELQKLKDRSAELPESVRSCVSEYLNVHRLATEKANGIKDQIEQLSKQNALYRLKMTTSDGREATLALGDIVRGYQPNGLSAAQKRGIYLDRWWEFLADEPREANSEGGVFPAIWGTVTMTLIMSLAVVPFGVLAAIYLREYAKSGPVISAVRIAINNLAGVPSIVFGVFGLGFFCYIIGAYIDGGPRNAGFQPLPAARWYAALAALALISVTAFVTGVLSAGPSGMAKGWRRLLGAVSVLLWLSAVGALLYVLITTPYFRGFYEANLPNPYWGKGGVLWSSLTLALMTLPVVIVATEEALSAVPNSMREGSYGCGASKWQTIRRVVLPQALPGIMTGMILAMARGAGEVAPLMLVGAVKLAPELPIDGEFPFVHGNRSFMHLGFHIFDLGFQSQNSEAARPMVYTTTLLLIVIITVLNLLAIWLRAYLRKRLVAGHF
jgi:ABC-type phosphate transport system permease subunit